MNIPSESLPAELEPHPTEPVVRSTSMSRGEIWLELCVVLAVGVVPYFVTAVVSLAAAAGGDGRGGYSTAFWIEAVQLIVSACSISVVVLYLIHRSGEPKKRFGIVPLRRRDWMFGLLIVLLISCSSALLGVVVQALGWTGGGYQFTTSAGRPDLVLLILMLVANSLAEELVARAYLITRLEQLSSSKWTALILSTVLFASYHCYQGVVGMASSAMIGLVFGGVFLAIRRLWPLVIAHTVFNIGVYFWAMQR